MSDSEFKGTLEDLRDLDSKVSVGYLGILTPDLWPRVTPVNFVILNGKPYWHGSQYGEKFELLRSRPNVTFCIALEYAMIPSTWRSDTYACTASNCYKSALIKGVGVTVESFEEKAEALGALMRKHQEEGSWQNIDPTDPMYAKALVETGIFRVDPDVIDIRRKFAQNKPESVRQEFIKRLEERAEGFDLEAAKEIRKTLDE